MLKRDISTTNIIIAAAGSMIGSGWLFSSFLSAQIAGSLALLSWVLGTILMLFIALPLCELGALIPISGGMANYPTLTHGKEVGFLFAWITWLSYVVMTPIETIAILQYASHFLPFLVEQATAVSKLSGYGYVAAAIIMLIVVLFNTFGIKILAECNKYVSLIKFIIPSLAIISLLLYSPSWSNLNILPPKQNWQAIFSALSMGGIIFAFTGFQNGLMLAGEVKNPQRNIPLTLLGAIGIGFILYFMLQLSFLVAVPQRYLAGGWQQLHFPGANGPLVGLTMLLGLYGIAALLTFDAAFSPFGSALVYTAATSRILYGMALNQHLPAFLLKLNQYKIPYLAIGINFLAGLLVFLPFPNWQKMVEFLSSASILSYGIGPICLLAFRKLQPYAHRPFKLPAASIFSHIAFYACNLMLYWCGFSTLWKLYVATVIGLFISLCTQGRSFFSVEKSIYWFFAYFTSLLILSYLGSFGGIKILKFPLDLLILLPFSLMALYFSQFYLNKSSTLDLEELKNYSHPN